MKEKYTLDDFLDEIAEAVHNIYRDQLNRVLDLNGETAVVPISRELIALATVVFQGFEDQNKLAEKLDQQSQKLDRVIAKVSYGADDDD